jgi:hypothetical protein
MTTPATSKAGFISRLGSRRILLLAAGALVLVVLLSLGLLYLNARKPPELQLASVDFPSDAINAQTAQVVVNLERWETGSFIDEIAYSPDGGLLGTANNRDWERFSRYRY